MVASAYTQFVSQHIRSMPGANQKDKMRAVAAKWRALKGRGKGKGLHLSGRGVRHHGKCTMGCTGKRHRKGCGFWDDVWEGVKGAAKIAGPRLIDLALKRIGAGRKKGRGAMPLYPGREGASGGRVRRGKGTHPFFGNTMEQVAVPAVMRHAPGRGKQSALAAALHGLGLRI